MAIADGLQYIQSVVLGLIVSFLLAKVFSIVFSSGDENDNLGLTGKNPNERQPEVISSAEKDKRSVADFSKEPLIDSDDDWEGVETTELEDAFCAATAYVAAIAADRSSKKVSSSLQLKLYGLYKIATEGACSVPQPSAIKITARAKWNLIVFVYLFHMELLALRSWNAWHELGAMSQEEAMQKYLEIITELDPSWADDVRIILSYSEDQTPLRQTVDRDHIDINIKDNEGQTPLHHAAVHERDETGALLVKKNAATGVQDDEDDDDGGNYPSDLSHSNWHSIQP
ncbi:hypothetical protein L1987_11853 [Smallanthus sonchifolius]|uniref:Uncharacterized protein n=1 Tax=Smallanthus sonchifolius TaxID=185202 RepID=A0ACB9JEA4_9ASTR|nr:hypothetical protein L1987_11853 [Smallanthus sonchifolius]